MNRTTVTWRDSFTFSGWVDVDFARSMTYSVIQTTGYVVHEDDDVLVIVQSTSNTDNVLNTLAIPKCCIVKRK